MRGFTTNLKDPFKSGLRPTFYTARNTGVLIDALNCIATKTALVGYTPDLENMPDIYTSGGVKIDLSISWPFPQVFQTDTGLYIGNQVGLYQIAYDATYGFVGTNLTDGFTGTINWPWTCANCPGFPLFSSGDILVYYDTDTAGWKWWAKGVGGSAGDIWDSEWYQPVSVAYNRGQFMAAGAKVHTTFPSQNREIKWSAIGKAKFLKTPLSHAELLTVIENTAGGMFGGSDDYEIIMRVLPYEKGFIVYGTFAIYALMPVTDPVPAFSVSLLRDIGIANPLAVGGPIKGEGSSKQIFVDRMGVLWQISPGQQGLAPQRLGYEEYLAPLQKNASIDTRTGLISITYNPYKDEYYISNGQKSFIYNGVGLTPMDKCITGVVDFQNAQVTTGFHYTALKGSAFGYFYELFNEYKCMAKTDIIDMDIRGQKTLETIHLGVSVPAQATCEVMVEWRNAANGVFRKTPWKRVSPEGIVSPIVTGVDFRIIVKCSDWDGFELSDWTLFWKLVNKQGIRGAYASNTNAGANG